MGRYSKIIILLVLITSSLSRATASPQGDIVFRRGSDLLLKEYKSNAATLSVIENWIKTRYEPRNPAGGYVRIVGNYADMTPQAMNEASIQASCLVAYLKQVSGDRNFRFSFYLNHSDLANTIEVECLEGAMGASENRQIHYSKKQQWVPVALDRYPTSVFLKKEPAAIKRMLSDKANEYGNNTIESIDITKLGIAIYFKYDNATLYPTYLSNASSLQSIDSLMYLSSTQYIDSLSVEGFSSPEGTKEYNRRLSFRRAESVKEYLLSKYPNQISSETVITKAGGENWKGLLLLAENDKNLPMKEQVLSILTNESLTDIQRKSRLQQLGNGTVYRNYLLPRYFKYLRNGASLKYTYRKIEKDTTESDIVSLVPPVEGEIGKVAVKEQRTDSVVVASPVDRVQPIDPVSYDTSYVRPIAFKTNMLYILATALNVEIEVPVAPQWSIAGEWMFPWWVGEKKQHALQLLQGSLEARYWINPNYSKQEPRLGKHNPLTGWFVGAYGSAGYYDFEMNRKGFQGDLFGAGLSAGYVMPLARNFNMEFSLGVGYLQSSYWNYEAKQDFSGEWHLIRTTKGKMSTFALPVRNEQSGIWLMPYKAKVSFIWYPHFRSIKKKGGSK